MKNFKKILVVILIIFVLAGLISSGMFFDENKAKKQYSQGLTFLNENDYENAFFNFMKISKYSYLYEPALFHQIEIAFELKDYNTAILKGETFLRRYPQSILTSNAKYNLARAYFFNEDFEKAKNIFEHLSKKSLKCNFSIASNYYLAKIYKNEPLKAKDFYINYLKMSPTGKFYANCIYELEMPKFKLSNEEKLIIGISLFENQRYQKTITYLNQLNEKDVWAYLSICYQNLNNKKLANKIFEKDFVIYSKKVPKELLQRSIDLYVSSQNLGREQDAWKKVLNKADINNSQGRDYILYRLSKFSKGQEKYNYSKQIYQMYSKGDFASEALWEMFWFNYQNNQLSKAAELGKKHISQYQNTNASPKILYWMGKISALKKNQTEANNYYTRILVKYPDDFYAFRANSKIHKIPYSWASEKSNKVLETLLDVQIPIQYSNLNIKDIKFLNTLIDMNDFSLLVNIDFGTNFIISWLEFKKGNIPISARLARDELSKMQVKPVFQDDVYKLAYPLKFPTEINAITGFYNIDTYLILALIREESYFNTNAISSVGAKGLMQLMPSTANYIANLYNIKYSSLFDIEDNLKLGCVYYKYIKNQLGGCDLFAIGAYNGGPNAVGFWKNNLKYNDYDEFIENIPYPETQNYIKKVYRSYWNYLNIYK